MKKLFCPLLVFVTAMLHATVMPFAEFMREGTPVLVPGVQKYEAASEAYTLPPTLTVSVPSGEELIVDLLAEALQRFPETKVQTAQGNAAANCRFIIDDATEPAHAEGYLLRIDKEGVTVRSRSGAGLFYGAQTLCNIINDVPSPQLPGCRITDYPDLDKRGYFFTIRGMPPQNIPQLKKMLDVLAKLKINWILLELAEAFPFTENPFPKRRNAFTREEVLDIQEYCARHHIAITPTLQVWSHALWMTGHPDWEKMSEGTPDRAWSSQPCPLSQQARDLTAMAIKEHLELFKPKDFFLMMDEFYLGPHGKCPKCKNANLLELFAGIVKQYEGQVLEAGATPIVCHDSFLNLPGRWSVGDALREKLDRRTNILWWNYTDVLREPNIIPFKEFQLIGHAVNGKPLNVWNMSRLIQKYGGRASTMVYWYYSNGGMLYDLAKETPDSLGGFVNGADYMWRLTDTHYASLGYDGTFEMMRRLYPEKLVARPQLEHAGPVPLENSVNAELSCTGRFPHFTTDAETAELKAALAALPERFHLVTSPGGKYYGLRLTGYKDDRTNRQAIAISLGSRKASQLSFLMTASRSTNPRAYAGGRFYGEKRFQYPVVATLDVTYADGTNTVVNLGYRREIVDWNRTFGGTAMRFAVRGLDSDQRYYSFGIFDWRNPHPEKPIKTIVFGTKKTEGISPVLLALSAYGADHPLPKPAEPFNPAAMVKRVGVNDGAAPKPRIVADFEQGMGDVTVNLSPSLKENTCVEIVDDPTSPSGGKVLKITIPKGEYTGRAEDGNYLRISIDMPYSIPKGTKNIQLDHRIVAAPTGFSYANHYLVDNISPVANPNDHFLCH
ncbi:MAG: beta-N-acetylhexosaminidase, partial [Victivallales bacterium]|nr:beta-N-acetylhexosaminidase [Victivallales bacterium]